MIAAKDLARSFGGIRAVDGVSFELKANQVLGIIGPNGSGKTTLVNLLTGFVKPDQGRILFKGKDV
ncbi:MAG: ATP-binding cassette domain-containing protein, partial [Deltaproteobacteria bacterium]|nr:ATP-binding cassette domain-containing protein [Deltaproteobacteria bacterium]